ncbi:uncharacterized protein LOC135223991 [Macrobrachium nipponense]|uniref:uncharacterized protein LOC135223991 n=1 Tax=Macrobrachium nipponense TaxID=159736 RepID=UPI0030C84D89
MNSQEQLPVEGLTSPINGQGLPRQGRARLKKQVQAIRMGTLNVGSMNGRSREVADVLERRRVDILCEQETRWRENKAKDIGNGYKLLCSRADETGRGGVWIAISKEMKENIVSGCSEEVKNKFWRDMDEVMI